MRAEEVTFDSEASREIRAEIEAVVAESTNFEELIEKWYLERGNSMVFFSPVDHEPAESGVEGRQVKSARLPSPKPLPHVKGVSLQINSRDVAEVYYATTDIVGLYPDVPPLTNYIRGFGSWGDIELDDDAIERWQRFAH